MLNKIVKKRGAIRDNIGSCPQVPVHKRTFMKQNKTIIKTTILIK